MTALRSLRQSIAQSWIPEIRELQPVVNLESSEALRDPKFRYVERNIRSGTDA